MAELNRLISNEYIVQVGNIFNMLYTNGDQLYKLISVLIFGNSDIFMRYVCYIFTTD